MAHCAVRPRNLNVVATEEKDNSVRGSRELVKMVGKDHRLDAGLLMLVGEKRYDVLLAVVN